MKNTLRLALAVLIMGGLLAAPSRATIEDPSEPIGVNRAVANLRASTQWPHDVLVRSFVNEYGELEYRASIVQLNGSCDDSAQCARRIKESADKGCTVKQNSSKATPAKDGADGTCEGTLICPTGQIQEVTSCAPSAPVIGTKGFADQPDPIGKRFQVPWVKQ